MSLLALLHLCDSLFPVGGFAYSDGLEAAASGAVRSGADLRGWIDVCLRETIGRSEGPTLLQAWTAFHERDWDMLVDADREAIALRPSSATRRASRAMGSRLLTTWQALHPDQGLDHVSALTRSGALGPALPVAFAVACAASGVDRRASAEAFAYTRLAATVSAAMRLMAIGQMEAHRLLADALDCVPATLDAMLEGDDNNDWAPEAFAPALDIAAMTQQYLHTRLFRS